MKDKIKQLHINEKNEYMYSEYRIGKYHYIGKDIKKEVIALKNDSDKGDSDAQYALGICYHRGFGVIPSIPEAVKLYELAGNQGNSDAQVALAMILHYDELDVSYNNIEKAYELYCKASKNGNICAMVQLADLYYRGYKSIQKNIDEAIKLWSILAINGKYVALQNLKNHFS
jgi:TPR repeat protein